MRSKAVTVELWIAEIQAVSMKRLANVDAD
jgi:hypothetical protein